MSKELSANLNPLALPAAPASVWLRSGGIALAGSALVAVCAHLALPLVFTPVPLSMAPFAVLVLGLLLSPRLAFATLALYLAEGAAGLPVFAPGPLGLAHLLGPTGGYLLSYPLAAPLVSFLYRRTRRSFPAGLLAAGLGSLLILALGSAWLGVATHGSLLSLLTISVLPYLPGDALKVAAAAGIAAGFQRLRRQQS